MNQEQFAIQLFNRQKFSEVYDKLKVIDLEQFQFSESIFAFAVSCLYLSKLEECLNAIDKFLSFQPKHIMANIVKADCLLKMGHRRKATNFYDGALKLAARQKNISPQLQAALSRAEVICRESALNFRQRLADIKKAFSDSCPRRVQHSLDILLGDRVVYLQQPTKFFYPELANIQFFEPSVFPEISQLVDGIDDIRKELEDIMQAGVFKPYIDHNPDAPTVSDLKLVNNKEWSAFHFIKEGARVNENILLCPKTFELVSQLPMPEIPGKSPNVLFSALGPGTHIPPHHGQTNVRLLCHIPLIVPGLSWIRVGNETRRFQTGEPLVFDDSIEHEAKNEGDDTRVVLIVDLWRPELDTFERQKIAEIFEVIESEQ